MPGGRTESEETGLTVEAENTPKVGAAFRRPAGLGGRALVTALSAAGVVAVAVGAALVLPAPVAAQADISGGIASCASATPTDSASAAPTASDSATDSAAADATDSADAGTASATATDSASAAPSATATDCPPSAPASGGPSSGTGPVQSSGSPSATDTGTALPFPSFSAPTGSLGGESTGPQASPSTSLPFSTPPGWSQRPQPTYTYNGTPPGDTNQQEPYGQISRAEILQRAISWVDERVPYSETAWWSDANGTYRQDCSGYVSMAWALDQQIDFWTGNLNTVSHTIAPASLLPGDILLSDSHTVLFAGWADAAHTMFDYYEESMPGTVAHFVTGAPLSAFLESGFTPFRYNGVVGAVGANAQSGTGIPFSVLNQNGNALAPVGTDVSKPPAAPWQVGGGPSRQARAGASAGADAAQAAAAGYNQPLGYAVEGAALLLAVGGMAVGRRLRPLRAGAKGTPAAGAGRAGGNAAKAQSAAKQPAADQTAADQASGKHSAAKQAQPPAVEKAQPTAKKAGRADRSAKRAGGRHKG